MGKINVSCLNSPHQAKDNTSPLSTLAPLLRKSDFSLAAAGTVNYPAAAGHRGVGKSTAQIEYMHLSGLKALSVAGMETVPGGLETALSFCADIRQRGLEFAGISPLHETAVYTSGGITFGLISFGDGLRTMPASDTTAVKQAIAALDSKCDIVIAAFDLKTQRGRRAYATAAEKTQYLRRARAIAHACVDAGADIVVGGGARDIMPMELYQDRAVVYGLAEFYTGLAPASTEQEMSPVIEIELYADGLFKSAAIHSYKKKGTAAPTADESRYSARRIAAETARLDPDTPLRFSADGKVTSALTGDEALARRLTAEAIRHRGKRYRGGSSGPMTFDCSGFTSYVYSQIGIKLKRSSRDQYTMGTHVDKSDLRPGDLVFFKGSATARTISHVGIVYSVDGKTGDFKFIHASPSRGIVIDDFGSMAYYIKRYVGARRILSER